MNDRGFLEAICENPHDIATRLIFADWLDERGDPRGEFCLIRLEKSDFTDRISGPERVLSPPDGSYTTARTGAVMSEQSNGLSVDYQLVPDFPGYFVGNDGSVWSCWERFYRKGEFRVGVLYRRGAAWTRMKMNRTGGGYLEVQLRKEGRVFHALVHRLVLSAFIGPAPEGFETFHINNIPSDNRLSNLRWASKSENQCHRRKFGTDSSGERHGLASLTNEEAQQVRERFKVLRSKKLVAQEFGVSRYVVSDIINGKSYLR